MQNCLVCGDRSNRPLLATLHHFRLYESGNWSWMRGNMKQFGRWRGFVSTCYLVCPLLNALRHWKYRKCRLVLPDGKPLESAFDENGCALPSHKPAEQKP